MGSAFRRLYSPQLMLALWIACATGCGTSYELPPAPPPLEHADPGSFTIRSLTINGREITDGNAGEFTADEPLEVKGLIDFQKGRPHPPIVLLVFADTSGERPVNHGSSVGRLGTTTPQGTPFTLSEEAPSRPGKFTMVLTAKPPKPARQKPGAVDKRQPLIYVEAEITVVEGEARSS